MIPYNRSAFGLNLLFRLHGSPLYRSVIPAFMSMIVSALFRIYWFNDNELKSEIEHPYAVGMVISGITFLIVFRASQGYNRYWDAATRVYNMQSKWMDASIHTAVYHLQCDHFKSIQPPSFNDYHELNAKFLTRDRERVRDSRGNGKMSRQRLAARSINKVEEAPKTSSVRQRRQSFFGETLKRSPSLARLSLRRGSNDAKPVPSLQDIIAKADLEDGVMETDDDADIDDHIVTSMRGRHSSAFRVRKNDSLEVKKPIFLTGTTKLDGNWGKLFPDGKNTYYDQHAKPDPFGFASTVGGRTPSLFLQELAHLTSLLNAVALSTLRNDVDGAESPLDLYEIGSPWPEVDPSRVPNLYDSFWSKFTSEFSIFIGRGRSPELRTLYNSRRPLPVIGGVSDGEIAFLQRARGKYAKTQLCWNWLSEFCIREHLAGSMGKVGAPIISRTIQFLGDGMVNYNQARKITFVPFPFPHAQVSAFFVIVMIPLIPLLMDQYIENLYLGLLMTFLAQMILSGINEVATELENPFRNVPNELPVVFWQAEFNETLLTMFSGYHPDFFWDGDEDDGDEEDDSDDDSLIVNPNTKLDLSRHSYTIVEEHEKEGEAEKKDTNELKKLLESQGKIIETLLTEQMKLNERLNKMQ